MLVFLSLPIIGRDTTVGIMCFLGWTILDACVWILCDAKERENACHAVCLAIPLMSFTPIHPPIAEPFHNPLTPSSFRTRLEPIHPPIAEPVQNPFTPSNCRTLSQPTHPSNFRTLSEPIHPTLFQRPLPYVFQNPHSPRDPTPTQFIL